MFLEGLLPESGFVGHHYSVLKERLRAPLVGALARFLLGPPAQRVSTSPWPPCDCPGRGTPPNPRATQTQLLENCIASTSILKIPSYKEPTVDALAPDADEGRGWLR